MAVTATIQSLKVKVVLEKGSVTVPRCNPDATDPNIKTFGEKIASLCNERRKETIKIQDYLLVGQK